ncbi:RibD family protein [Halobacillus trueperi]|uniref:RibD family protein n=1 Tax=Halobacillus trueperi TaxID=156205 RepID=UPI0015F25601|nr:RibD family protein [Halobacillus trueperi]
MKKPEVVLNVFSSIDGKITTAPKRDVAEWTAAGIDGEAQEVTHQLYDELDCDGLVSGSESLIVWGANGVELDRPIYEPKKSKAYIVFDGRGRIDWYQTEGLLVVTREDVSKKYIQQLEEKGITYISAGTGAHIDLPLALHKLYELGYRRLGLSGGGVINGAFLRQGLIDEISLVIAPLAIGGTTTPSIFDSEDLKELNDVTRIELKNMKTVGNGSIWLHYKVMK